MSNYRTIVEEHIGRKLTKDEIVHHINGIPGDDRIENLQIVTKGEHSKLHKKMRGDSTMKRINLYIGEDQVSFIKNLGGLSLSEHIRRAIDAYIDELKGNKVSASQSKKVGELDA